MKNGKKIVRHSLILLMLAILTLSGIAIPKSKPVQAANYTATNWMAFAKFGVMTHFLPHLYGAANNQSAWNDILRNFDANWFATQVQNSGAKYVIFPIGQYDPNLDAPNATYESLLGVSTGTYAPTTDDADIIKKLIPALSSRGIRLMLYYPLSGPRPSAGNNSDINKLSFPSQLGATVNWNTGAITYTQTFLNNIASIIKVYSDRYGTGISGWWLDDAFSVYGLNNSNRSWLDSVRNAAKSGNSDSVITFNRGVDTFKRFYENDDYLAGEASNLNFIPNRRWVDGVQFQAMTYLGDYWTQGNTRFSNATIASYVQQIASVNGTVSLDVRLDQWGTISQSQKDQLNYIGSYLNNHPIASPGAGWDNPSSLMMNQYLKPGDYLVNYDAVNPSFALMQSDGNFAIYAGTGPDFISGGALWATNTYNPNQSRYALMQSDGNFCINPGTDPFHNLGGAVWCSNRTQSGGEYFLNLQGDRNLVVNRNYQYFWGRME